MENSFGKYFSRRRATKRRKKRGRNRTPVDREKIIFELPEEKKRYIFVNIYTAVPCYQKTKKRSKKRLAVSSTAAGEYEKGRQPTSDRKRQIKAGVRVVEINVTS